MTSAEVAIICTDLLWLLRELLLLFQGSTWLVATELHVVETETLPSNCLQIRWKTNVWKTKPPRHSNKKIFQIKLMYQKLGHHASYPPGFFFWEDPMVTFPKAPTLKLHFFTWSSVGLENKEPMNQLWGWNQNQQNSGIVSYTCIYI